MWKVAADVLWSSNLQRLLLAELKISLWESFLLLDFLPIISQKLFPVYKLTLRMTSRYYNSVTVTPLNILF